MNTSLPSVFSLSLALLRFFIAFLSHTRSPAMRFTAFVATFVALPFDFALARTVPFTVTITKEKHSPDGGPARPRYLMNGVSPGPALNIDEGDDVEFLVINASDEPTSIHFHGIE